MKNKFIKDLEKGEWVENKILSKIKSKYPKAYKIEGNFKYYDIEIPEINKTIEVKNDIGSENTSNYFIEISCNYENSGISTTKADYWVIYDEKEVIWIKTSILKAICDIEGKYWRGIPQGSKTEIEAFLIDKNIIKEKANKIADGDKYGL